MTDDNEIDDNEIDDREFARRLLLSLVPEKIEARRDNPPDPAEIREALRVGARIIERSANGLENAEAEIIFCEIADIVAIVAYLPGGLELFGELWEANP